MLIMTNNWMIIDVSLFKEISIRKAKVQGEYRVMGFPRNPSQPDKLLETFEGDDALWQAKIFIENLWNKIRATRGDREPPLLIL